jgi:hypothetical protein
MPPIKVHSVVRGEVVGLADSEVWIEVDFQRRAALPLEEFFDEGS